MSNLDNRAEAADTDADSPRGRRLAALSITALGVVFGDIGTSPLYAVRECFHGEYGIAVQPANVFGVISLVFWALVLVVTIKYLVFILRADNGGEGGVIALTALIRRGLARPARRSVAMILLGLFAACLLYGDGMITPAISVLSAVEGLRVIAPPLDPYVLPVTVGILVGLFLFQRRGTAGVGALFGPITLVWMVVLAALGLGSLAQTPEILRAVNPWYGARFLLGNGFHGFLVLGAVFLVVTGTEALYADLGHFGRRPIRLVWHALVLPSLACNYFGQGAVLLRSPAHADHPFYAMAPSWGRIPLLLLATAATIIASQAVISGAYSLTQQAIQLGYLPRLRIIHTSDKKRGQIYVPSVTAVLMLATVGLVLGFRSSSQLAAAYGAAVTTTMTITSVLFFSVARRRWGWSRLRAGLLTGAFLVVDLGFLVPNLSKLLHGAWFPFAIGLIIFALATTWEKGRSLLSRKLYSHVPLLTELVGQLEEHPPTRVEGSAVYMAGRPGFAPPALVHNLRHNRVLHEKNAVLTIVTESTPTVPRDEKLAVKDVGEGFFKVLARFGYMEDPSVPYVLALAREKGLHLELDEVSFFLGRERVVADRGPLMSSWRERLFAFMSHNALGATTFFHIPPDQVIEVGAQVKL